MMENASKLILITKGSPKAWLPLVSAAIASMCCFLRLKNRTHY